MRLYAKLLEAAPPWAVLLPASEHGQCWIAAPPLPSGTPTPATLVRTTIEHGLIFAAECQPGTRLPKSCPELHINTDASFCLERRVYRSADDAARTAFWQDLGEFLVNQRHVARRGRWPVGRWLSHGPIAADRQAEAEAAAVKANIADEYATCLEANEGWIAERASANHGTIARSAPCPRGCRNESGRGVPFSACRRRNLLQKIVMAEHARRAAQSAYFGALRRRGAECCGRVAGCPLFVDRIAA